MDFRITFYETANGDRPVVEFLESLRGKQDPLHKLAVAGLTKLRQRQNHGRPLTAWVEGTNGLFELRVGGTNIARIFLFFRPG